MMSDHTSSPNSCPDIQLVPYVTINIIGTFMSKVYKSWIDRFPEHSYGRNANHLGLVDTKPK